MTTLSEATDRLRRELDAPSEPDDPLVTVDRLDLATVLVHVDATSSTTNDSSDRLDALTIVAQIHHGTGAPTPDVKAAADDLADYLNGAS